VALVANEPSQGGGFQRQLD
jgi:hypothetical protein